MQNARRELLYYAIFRPESAIILVISIVMTGLSLLNIFWFPESWWLWLLFGIAGEAVIIATTMRDQQTLSRIAAKLFYKEFDTKRLQLAELQHKAATALEYHHTIFEEIVRRKTAEMSLIAADMDEWVARMFRVAQGLDTVVASPGMVFANIAGKDMTEANLNFKFPNKADTVQAFLDAMMVAAQQAATPRDGLQRLSAVGNTMIAASAQLDQSINSVNRIRFHLTQAAPNPNFDREFAEQARGVISDQLFRLDQASNDVESMYRTLVVPTPATR